MVGDIVSDLSDTRLGKYDHVMSNPPFFPAGTGQVPKNKARALATVESSADLSSWVQFMVAALRDSGTITLIHRAEREDEIIQSLSTMCGDFRIMELLPNEQESDNKLLVVQAAKGSRSTSVRRSELVLHQHEGEFTEEALSILRDAKGAPISDT